MISYTKLHGMIFSIRPEEGVLLDSETCQQETNIFCNLRNQLSKDYITE